MGSTARCFGLFFDDELAGVDCFGATAGTGVPYLCGPENSDHVMTLVRGACVHWAHLHSASFLISQACNLLAREGKNVFVAYSDPDAGEIGTVYQACNWFYCGMTADRGNIIVSPSGKMADERMISGLTRDRSTRSDKFFRKPTRAEMREKLIRTGYKFVPRTPKHRYVGVYAERRLKQQLIDALRWDVLPYPKRPSNALSRYTYKRIGQSEGDRRALSFR